MKRETVEFSVDDIGKFVCHVELNMKESAIVEMDMTRHLGFERNFFYKKQIADMKRSVYQKAEKAVFGDKIPEKHDDVTWKKVEDWIEENDSVSRGIINEAEGEYDKWRFIYGFPLLCIECPPGFDKDISSLGEVEIWTFILKYHKEKEAIGNKKKE